MPRLQLNKSSLARESAYLRTYERFLPSLDLKRQQLMAERAKARAHVRAAQEETDRIKADVAAMVPMLANDDIDLEALVSISNVEVGVQNVVGTELPVLSRVEFSLAPYSPMAMPHWVDDVARLLCRMLEAQLRLNVAQRRVALLGEALTTITQRVNLFDKVLIPTSRANIKKIRIYLSDEEMAAVVRSKIAKRKRAQA